MSLHTRWHQRIARTSAHRTAWRQRRVRYYTSQATNDPEWFQRVRTELLSRNPIYRREDVDVLHHEQLSTTLAGFLPKIHDKGTGAQLQSPSAHLLTRFNAQELSSKLLPDGTDALHCPGEPWVRRMWAGGAVQVHPDVRDELHTLRLRSRAACVERIKDVRLQGKDDAAKIFVTIERRFALVSRPADHAKQQLGEERYFSQHAHDGTKWGHAPLLKEERNLVFLKAKSAAELMAIQAGQTLVPKYLTSPADPDFAHTLTPTRSLLFRYSALTFNAHLLHLDLAYARDIEGHRNLLVHGPLTLTLMLQTLTKHLQWAPAGAASEIIESVQYRNLAPLYCDEEMRVCVKRKTTTDTGHAWDVWIEGPTGGMAVKAAVRTARRGGNPVSNVRGIETSTGAPVPNVHTVAAQAREKLSALDREITSTEQLFQLSRKERLRPNRESSGSVPSRPQNLIRWRKKWVGKALPYLYLWHWSPLMTSNLTEASQPEPAPASRPPAIHQLLEDSVATFTATSPSPSSSSAQQQRNILMGAAADAPSDLEKAKHAQPSSHRGQSRQRDTTKRPMVRRIEQASIRKVGDGLGTKKKKASTPRMKRVSKALKATVQSAGKAHAE